MTIKPNNEQHVQTASRYPINDFHLTYTQTQSQLVKARSSIFLDQRIMEKILFNSPRPIRKTEMHKIIDIVPKLTLIVILYCMTWPFAQAQVPSLCSELEISPNPASTFQSVSASIECSCRVPIEPPSIELSENEISISYRINGICGVPPAPSTYEFDLGRLPPGQYTVNLTQLSQFDGEIIEFRSAPLQVISTAVPVLTDKRVLLLLILVIALAAHGPLRRKVI